MQTVAKQNGTELKVLAGRTMYLLLSLLLCGSVFAVEQTATYNGEHTGDQFSISVSNAGDVAVDTFVYLLIGASLGDIKLG
jgi:hypothetical protein